MKKAVKAILQKSKIGTFILEKRAILLEMSYYLRKLKFKRFKNYSERFIYYYEKNIWGNDESVSGRGSTLEYTKNLRESLDKLFIDYNIKSITDAPCGDFNWLKLVNLDNILYKGCDIVPHLIKKNQELYGANNIDFSILNIINEQIPKADLWICRDVLFHFSNNDIKLTIDNYLKSDVEFLLTTSYELTKKNRNIKTGEYRPLNLQIEPFLFPMPILKIDDSNYGEHPGRIMGLWAKKDIISCL